MPHTQSGNQCGNSKGKSNGSSKGKETSTGPHTSGVVCPSPVFASQSGRFWKLINGHIQNRPFSQGQIHLIVTHQLYMCVYVYVCVNIHINTYTHRISMYSFIGNTLSMSLETFNMKMSVFSSYRHIIWKSNNRTTQENCHFCLFKSFSFILIIKFYFWEQLTPHPANEQNLWFRWLGEWVYVPRLTVPGQKLSQ